MTVLLVEDEISAHDELVEALVDKGFAVHIAGSVDEAIRQLALQGPRYKAAIINTRVGWNVSRFARELIHDLPIVYISAHDPADWASRGVPNSVMVQVPVDIPALLSVLDDLIEQRRRTPYHGGNDDNSGEIRRVTIGELSDEALVRYFSLLSDTRVVSNVDALADLEDEIVRRGLPIGRKQ